MGFFNSVLVCFTLGQAPEHLVCHQYDYTPVRKLTIEECERHHEWFEASHNEFIEKYDVDWHDAKSVCVKNADRGNYVLPDASNVTHRWFKVHADGTMTELNITRGKKSK